jgi:hypothetical protein
MDKKAKKRLEVLRKKKTELDQKLSGAKQQMDDPNEVKDLEKQLAAVLDEMSKLKEG